MSRVLLFINGVVLLGCAVFLFEGVGAEVRSALLTILFLLLPFFDRQWSPPGLRFSRSCWFLYAAIISLLVVIAVYRPAVASYILLSLVLTALPEEWFFRAYFMTSLQRALKKYSYYHNWYANVITSLLFALMHVPSQGWFGLSVFLPSIFFGWLYQKSNEFLLVVVMHTFFNVIYFVFVQDKVFG